MKNLAIIPARGGSKRIPRKNIKDFLGKPIIAYSIETALESELFDEVMVSTDDKEIAEISKEYGAEVPFMRSDENADDHATLADVVDEVRESYTRINRSFEYVCCILATAPLIDTAVLEKGLTILKKSQANTVKPVVRFSYPIQRAVRMNQEGVLEMFKPEHMKTRSQDLEPAYHDAGQFYWCRYELGMRGNNKIGFEISELLVQDIDNEEDWEVAELKYLRRNQKS